MIIYQDHTNGVTIDKLVGFFQSWQKPISAEKHLKVLNNSSLIVLAIDKTNQRIVGFITALTDHIQAAFISLLEVIPPYRHQGIGTELMKRMLVKLEDVTAVDLMCNPDTQTFYTKFAMRPSVGMVLRK